MATGPCQPTRRAGWVLPGALLVVALFTSACAESPGTAGAASATTAAAPTSTTAAPAVTDAVLQQKLTEINELCLDQFPDHCAGVMSVGTPEIVVDGPEIKEQLAKQGVDPSLIPSAKELAAVLEKQDELIKKLDDPKERAALEQQYRKAFEGIDWEALRARMSATGTLDQKQVDANIERLKKLVEDMRSLPKIGSAAGSDAGSLSALLAGAGVAQGNQLVVYRRPLAALDATIRRKLEQSGVDVRFVDARYSFRYLDDLGQRILRGPMSSRFKLESAVPEVDGSGVQIVTPDASRARRALRQEYGPAVRVVKTAQVNIPTP